METKEQDWFWHGVSLGLGTAHVIAERHRASSIVLSAIKEEKARVDSREKDRAAADGDAEYQSWIDPLPAMLETASWHAI